jgi:hypothetical protein
MKKFLPLFSRTFLVVMIAADDIEQCMGGTLPRAIING